jgi:hypothetical protein
MRFIVLPCCEDFVAQASSLPLFAGWKPALLFILILFRYKIRITSSQNLPQVFRTEDFDRADLTLSSE